MPGVTILNETHEPVDVALYHRPPDDQPVAWQVITTLAAMAGDTHELPARLSVVVSAPGGRRGERSLESAAGRLVVAGGEGGELGVRQETGRVAAGEVEVHNGLGSDDVEVRLERGGHPVAPTLRVAAGESVRLAGLDRWYASAVGHEVDAGRRLSAADLESPEVEVEPGHNLVVTGSRREGLHLFVR